MIKHNFWTYSLFFAFIVCLPLSAQISKDGYSLVYSSETPEAADANLNDPTIDVYILDDANATGIGEIRDNGSGRVIGIYSIDGRRLSKVPTKGVCIVDGKKILVK